MTEPVVEGAVLEFGDAVVLRAEGDEARDGRPVAALDVGAQELAALREAEGVDGGRGREDGVRGQVGADFGDGFRQVVEEGGAAVGRGVVGEADVVHVRARVGFFGEGADGLEAVGGVAVGGQWALRLGGQCFGEGRTCRRGRARLRGEEA